MTIEIEAGASQSQYSTKRWRCRRRISQAAQSMYCPESLQTPRSSKSQRGVIDMTQLRKLEEQVAAWSHVSVHPHRFGGRDFRFGNPELGHVHLGGTMA